MAVQTLLAEAVRGSFTSASFSLPAGAPGHVRLRMVSSVYGTDPTLTAALQVEQSFDGGATWDPWFGASGNGGSAGSVFRGVTSDGLLDITGMFDGTARRVRGTVTVNTPFSWGLTGELLP